VPSKRSLKAKTNMKNDQPTLRGIIYLRSSSECSGATVWIKRDLDISFDIKITDYRKGQFSIVRMSSNLYPKEELFALGHEVIEEDDFNNAFIAASRWILYNLPSKKSTRKKIALSASV